MNFETLHHFEIGLMQHLQAIRTPWLDQIMLLLNWVDTFVFYSFVIVCTWYAYRRKTGIHLLFLYVLGVWVIQNVKDLCGQPRPFELDPSLGLLTADSFGFPSGAAQVLIMLFGFLALTVRKEWFWYFTGCFLLLIGFSRVYLGLHFPSDIIGGWVIGGVLLFLYSLFEPSLEGILSRQSRWRLLLLTLGSVLFLIFFSRQWGAFAIVFGGFGASIGLIFAPRFAEPKHFLQKAGRVALAYSGFFVLPVLIVAALRMLVPPQALRYIVTFTWGAWVSFGVPCVLNLVKLFKRA